MKPFKQNAALSLPVICLTILVCRLLASWVFSSFDDAFITYRYGVNLARGYGFIYNPGEKVLGTTAPLFGLICSLPALMAVPVPKFILGFNILCDLATVCLAVKYLFGDNHRRAMLFGLLFAVDPSANRISVGGMEANLFLLCSVIAIILFEKERRVPAFILSAVIYFLRPEAVILFGLFFVFDWQRTKRIPLVPVLAALAIVAPPLYVIWHYYGHILPQSVIAKNQQGVNPLGSLVKSVFFSTPFSYAVFPLAVYGATIGFRERTVFKLFIAWITLYAAAYLIRGPWILNWYIYSIATVELILAAVALDRIMKTISGKRTLSAVWIVAALSGVTIWIAVAFIMGRSGVEKNVFSRLQQDFQDGGAKHSVIFADDIGALGFYTDAYIYDDLMLVSPQAAAYPNARERILHLEPDYLFVYADPNYLHLIATDPVISTRYRFVKRYSKTGETDYPAAKDISPTYKQDFILMKRQEKK